MVDLFSACALDCVVVYDCVLFCRLGVFVVGGGGGGLVVVIGSCVVVRCSLFYVGLVLCCAWCLLCLVWGCCNARLVVFWVMLWVFWYLCVILVWV